MQVVYQSHTQTHLSGSQKWSPYFRQTISLFSNCLSEFLIRILSDTGNPWLLDVSVSWSAAAAKTHFQFILIHQEFARVTSAVIGSPAFKTDFH